MGWRGRLLGYFSNPTVKLYAQARGEQLLFTDVPYSDNDHFPLYSNWCFTDESYLQTATLYGHKCRPRLLSL